MDDLLKTRPKDPKPAEDSPTEEEKESEERDRDDLIHIKSLHSQWAETRVLTRERGGRKRRKTSSRAEWHGDRKAGLKRSRQGTGSPRLLQPLPNTPEDRAETAISLYSLVSQHRNIQTPFPKQSMLIGPENPRVLQSFLVNFLQDDLGTFRKRIDLTKHGKDSGSIITDATLQELADLHPHVEGILLRGCTSVTDVGLWALARNCQLLTELDFSGCHKLTHIGLRSLALRCSGLQRLSLDNCVNINDLALRVVAAGCTQLRCVSLANCVSITDGGITELVKCCRAIQVLNLTGCIKICEFGDKGLIEIGQNCAGLVELNLTGCDNVRDGGIRAIARGCPDLQTLHCSGCTQISGGAARALGRGCPKLTRLSLNECKKLSNQDLWTIAECLPLLEHLSLRGVVKIRSRGIRGICEYCVELKSLDLSGCHKVDNEALTIIGNALKKLERADLSNNSIISSTGVENLCNGCTRLIHLQLANCKKVSRSFLKDLATQLPFVECSPDPSSVALVPRTDAWELIRETEKMRIHHAAAVVIQKMVRGVRARGGVRLIRRFAQRKFVVPKVQAYVRGYFVRKHLNEARLREQQRKAAILLQKYYRGHKGRQRARQQRRIAFLQKDEHLAATRIQAAFRGWKGRCEVIERKRLLALQALEATEQRRREEMMALRIQRLFRGRKGRLEYLFKLELKIQREQQAFAEKMAAMKVQSIWRQRTAYKERMRRKAEEIQKELEKRSATTIQNAFRSMQARVECQKRRERRRWQLEQVSAMKIQQAWRGCKGRHIFAVMKSLARLNAYEAQAATTIGSWWRGLQSRHVLEFLRIAKMQKEQLCTAAINIQRVFRGHKGRESREVMLEMKKISSTLEPLKKEERELVATRDKAKKDLEDTIKHLKKLKSKIAVFETELVEVAKHQSQWYDSSYITGTMQRYKTTYLASALRGKIEELRAELNQAQVKTIDELKTTIRRSEKRLRDLRKELGSPELNVEFNIRQNRAAKIRKRLKETNDAAQKIQEAFLSYRVRLAISVGGDHWQEQYDEVSGAKYFYNVRTQEVTYDKPWTMLVLERHGERMRRQESMIDKLHNIILLAQEADVWSEYFDEGTGYPFYYNKKTGEYRWEMPPEFRRKLEERSKDQEWLDKQNSNGLTARSARLRDVASGWVEYEDPESGEVYYYNAVTQETQWEKPVNFESEWVQEQDLKALTARSSKVRQVAVWVEYVDDEGHTYYFNNDTGEAQWEKPAGFDVQWIGENEAALTSRSVLSKQLGDAWQELLDPETGYTYYYNRVTGETSWSLAPGELERPLSTEQQEHQESDQVESQNEFQEEYQGQHDIIYEDDTGAAYFYKLDEQAEHHELPNSEWQEQGQYNQEQVQEDWSHQVVQDWPEKEVNALHTARSIALNEVGTSGWQEMLDTETNCIYYYNTETGETAWTMEEAMSNATSQQVLESSWAYDPEADLDEEALEALRNRDPMTFTSATRLLEIYEAQLMYDQELHTLVARLVECEAGQPDLTTNAEHVECMQWVAEYVITGQLLSALSVAKHAMERLELAASG